VVERIAQGLKRFAPELDARDYLAVGDAKAIVDRIDQYKAAGVSKFVLRPIASGDDEFMEQTRRLIAEVLPVAQSAS